MGQLREPCTKPFREPCARPYDSTDADSFTTVAFYHPSYPRPAAPLLRLPALDRDLDENKKALGIHYDLALVACGIIANNKWSSAHFTTLDGTGIERPPGGLLTDAAYIFHVANSTGGNDPNYPVVPSFDFWSYPHGQSLLPQNWQNLTLPSVVGVPQDVAESSFAMSPCLLTGSWINRHHSHIVPKSAVDWFELQGMKACTLTLHLNPHDIFNMIPLRADVHGAFDDQKFCFVPKQVSHDPEAPQELYAHVFTPNKTLEDCELRMLYHNRKMHPPTKIAGEFIFARFAWTIFMNRTVFPFLQTRKRSFAIFLKDGSTDQQTTANIAKLIKPAHSSEPSAADSNTAATGNDQSKQGSAQVDTSENITESDSDRLNRIDSICAPINQKARVKDWLARMIVEAPTMPTE